MQTTIFLLYWIIGSGKNRLGGSLHTAEIVSSIAKLDSYVASYSRCIPNKRRCCSSHSYSYSYSVVWQAARALGKTGRGAGVGTGDQWVKPGDGTGRSRDFLPIYFHVTLLLI